MIVLQLLALILLIPLTFLMLFVFNIYSKNWLYLTLVFVFIAGYALMGSLVFMHISAAWIISAIVLALYGLRMLCLAKKLRANNSEFPVIQAKFNHNKPKIKCSFIFPLNFLKILRVLPDIASQKLAEKTGWHISIKDMINTILMHALGTKLEISHKEASIYFEVK